MSDLADALMSQLSNQQNVQALSQQVGAPPEKTQNAISTLLPVIMGAMQKKASTPQGAVDLQGMLGQLAGGMLGGGGGAPQQAPSGGGMPDLSSIIGAVMGGGRGSAPAPQQPQQRQAPQQQQPRQQQAPAGDMLDSIFGGAKQRDRVATGVGQATGMDKGAMDKLIAMLGPMVADAVAGKAKESNMDAGQLQGYLNEQRQTAAKKNSASGTLMGMILDQDGDGDFDTADMLALGMKTIFGGKK